MIVDDGAVKAELAGVLRLEVSRFEFDDDERAQPQMVEEQVDEELVSIDVEAIFAAEERDACAQFEEEVTKMSRRCACRRAEIP